MQLCRITQRSSESGQRVGVKEQHYWLEVEVVDGLLDRLGGEQKDFDTDISRGSAMTGALRSAFGPFNTTDEHAWRLGRLGFPSVLPDTWSGQCSYCRWQGHRWCVR